MKIIPTVMVRNEALYIQQVLRPLATLCEHVLVGDTGSSDDTPDIVRSYPNVELVFYGVQNPAGLRNVRADLGQRAAAYGAEWQFLCDGDELYSVATLRHILAEGLPAAKRTGFTTMLTLDDEPDGRLFELGDQFSRQCWMPAPETWTGDYPFEIPHSFTEPVGFHYFSLPEGCRYHAVHLHRLRRSPLDSEVYLRTRKQKQFSMMDRPNIQRLGVFDMQAWLAS